MSAQEHDPVRHNWSNQQALALLELPFSDLMFQAQSSHRRFFDANVVQVSQLCLTGSCSCALIPSIPDYFDIAPRRTVD